MTLRVKSDDDAKSYRHQAHQAKPQPATAETRASSQYTMKITQDGRPYYKDTSDIFSTLIISLYLKTQHQSSRGVSNSFSTDEVIQNLVSLKFSRSNRGPDPGNPLRIITTTVTFAFSMTRDMAMSMGQYFMDSYFIEHASSPSSNLFKDRRLYVITPKGLHILERFIRKNGIDASHLHHLFATQPMCPKLLHVERWPNDDDIILSQPVITAIFRWFVGHQPNYPANMEAGIRTNPHHQLFERMKGIPMTDIVKRTGKQQHHYKYCFAATDALKWLCEFISVVSWEEAAEIAAHFVQLGLITLVSDPEDPHKGSTSLTLLSPSLGDGSPTSSQAEFRYTAKAVYRVTLEGLQIARWTDPIPVQGVTAKPAHNGTTKSVPKMTKIEVEKGNVKLSMSDHLDFILKEPPLRSFFHDFLRAHFCEENLLFWIDVQTIVRKFHISSSVAGGITTEPGGNCTTRKAEADRLDHHKALLDSAFAIYNTYLMRASPRELNIDPGLHHELEKYLEHTVFMLTGKPFQGYIDPRQAEMFNVTHLLAMIEIYQRMQTSTFHLMLWNSVPEFIQTSKFLSIRKWIEDFGPSVDPSGETGKTHITYSDAHDTMLLLL